MEAIFYNIKSHIEPSIAKALEEAYFQWYIFPDLFNPVIKSIKF